MTEHSIELDSDINLELKIIRNASSAAVESTVGSRGTSWNIRDSQDETTFVITTNMNETECFSSVVEVSHWCYLYGVAILFMIAILLNGLSVVVFQSKSLRRFSFSVYLTALSVTDTIALFGYIPRKWLNLFYLSMQWSNKTTFYDSNTIACKSLTFATYVFRFLSSWLLVALACDRLTLSYNPYKQCKVKTAKFARNAIIYCIIAALIFNSHVLFTWKSMLYSMDPDQYSCIPHAPSNAVSVGLTITTILTIVGLPFFLLVGMFIATIRNFGSWRVRPKRVSANTLCRIMLEKRATTMVVVVTGVFCALSVPYTLAWLVLLVQHFLSPATGDDRSSCKYVVLSAARDICEVIFMINYSIKFMVCMFSARSILGKR